ncbi:MAG: hypothetical protein F6J89_33090, partial [Symploca sp. SIO1C4]|nr:hypothetical protein [Symploca sp. SIO1C4]
SLQLGSIRDHQIQEVTKPISQDDIVIEATDLSETAHKTLKKLGIRSTEDLRRAVDDQGIDLNAHTEEKIERHTLDELLNQARRRQNPPMVSKAKFTKIYNESVLILEGKNLMIFPGEGEFPVAVLDGKRVPVIAAGENKIDLKINRAQLENQPGKLEVALDHYAVINLTLKTNLNSKSALEEHDPKNGSGASPF